MHIWDKNTAMADYMSTENGLFFFLECGAYHNLSILGIDGAYAKFHAAVIGCQGKNS